MANKENVEKFLEIAGMRKSYREKINLTQNPTGKTESPKGINKLISQEVKQRSRELIENFVYKEAINLYMNKFSDQEIEELITIHSSSAYKKLKEINNSGMHFSADIFSDQEIEELITIHSSPDYKRLEAKDIDISAELEKSLTANRLMLSEKIMEISKEVMEKYYSPSNLVH